MKFALVLLVLTVSSALALTEDLSVKQWNIYKRVHGKVYETMEADIARYNIWKSNLDYIKRHNMEAANGQHTFTLAMNKFGDLTSTEFGRIYNGFNGTQKLSQSQAGNVFAASGVSVPDSIDWRTSGYVTPVKDQGQCGSCWSFSATGSLEGQHFKATGNLVSLSEQNLVDCSRPQGNMGCNGGLMDQAFTYIKTNKGIDTEASYPYHARDGKCQFNPSNVGATDTGFVDVKSKDENALKEAVGTVGPVSVAIDASHSSFQFYHSGVYHERMCSQTRLDHGVLAVGYGSDNGKDYWLVKNSWSASWGDSGYIKMSRGQNNNCGIATAASYPTV